MLRYLLETQRCNNKTISSTQSSLCLHKFTEHGHYGNWARRCYRYNACSQPVIFVRDSWVRERHAAYYRDRDGDGRRNGRDRRPNNPYVR